MARAACTGENEDWLQAWARTRFFVVMGHATYRLSCLRKLLRDSSTSRREAKVTTTMALDLEADALL